MKPRTAVIMYRSSFALMAAAIPLLGWGIATMDWTTITIAVIGFANGALSMNTFRKLLPADHPRARTEPEM